MRYRLLPTLSLIVWMAGVSLLPNSASAVPLNRGVVQDLRNQVRLLLKNQAPRPARRSDALTPGDALATARSALAEIRFNDDSLIRLGEQSLFRFQPNTRIFRLDNGTALLLIPPGRGVTRVRTPNAAAGIRGSALFVRYNPDTNTTLVGALTNSQIEVTNQDQSQNQPLKAGQIAVIIQSKIARVYDFDLNTFYESSELVKGLDLPRRGAASPDAAIAAVQSETAEALRSQSPIVGQGTIDTPVFVRLMGPQSTALVTTSQDGFEPMAFGSSPNRLSIDLQRLGWLRPGETGSRVVQSPSAAPLSIGNPGVVSSGLVSPPSGSSAPMPLAAIEPSSIVSPGTVNPSTVNSGLVSPPSGSSAPLPSAAIAPPSTPASAPSPSIGPAPSPSASPSFSNPPSPNSAIVQPSPVPPATIPQLPSPAPLPPAGPSSVIQPTPAPAPSLPVVQPTLPLAPPLPVVVQPTPAPAPIAPVAAPGLPSPGLPLVTAPSLPAPIAPVLPEAVGTGQVVSPPAAIVNQPVVPATPSRVEVLPSPAAIVRPGPPGLPTAQPGSVSVPLPGSDVPPIAPGANTTIQPGSASPLTRPSGVQLDLKGP
ncbi:MAG TPA: FecR domain-containing protein [Thermosynechococcaceae cyanobacterium]